MTSHDSENEAQVKVRDRRRYKLDEAGHLVERPQSEIAPRSEEISNKAADMAKVAAARRSDQPKASTSPQAAKPATSAGPAAAAKPVEETQEDKLASQIFLEFLNNLAHSFLVHLGEIPDPGSGLVRENLEAAQQTLEILGVLRKKTNGNLSAQEVRIFDSLIYELMMRLRQKVEAMRGVVPPRAAPRG